MRVFIADDIINVRRALRCILETEPGVTVVGEAATFDQITSQVYRIWPDILLLDWNMPELTLKSLSLLRARFPTLLIIVLSAANEAESEARMAGVHTFVSKFESPEKITSTLQKIYVERKGS